MEFVDGSLMKNSQGKDLYCKYWKPETVLGKARALVFICHDYGEHCAVYNHVAKALTEKGCFVFAHDHVGHGNSKGTRVLATSFRVYVKDVLKHIDIVEAVYPELPLFIVGHGMGGLIAIYCGLDRLIDFDGMALIAPSLASPQVDSPFQRFMINVVGRLCTCVEVGHVDTKLISSDEEEVRRYEEDPLVWHGGIKAGHALEMEQAIDALDSRMDDIMWSLLIQHGTADGLAPISGSLNLNHTAASSDKTISIMQDAYHQLHTEPNGVGEMCVNEVASWIQDRMYP